MAHKIYTNTPDDARALRDTLVDAVLSERCLRGSNSNVFNANFLKLTAENPALAVDVLQCCLSPPWQCKTCDDYDVILIRPCVCPQVAEVCNNDACIAQYVRDSVCWECHETGTVAPPKFDFEASTNPKS